MKKRIFISIYYLHLGGAETSLIGLLNALDTEKYDVDLFVFHHVGEMMQYIPKGINLLPEEPMYAHMDGGIKQCVKDGYWRMAFKRIIAQKKFCRYAKKHNLTDYAGVYTYIAREVCPILPSLEKYGEYDLAISYIIPHQVVLEKVKAKKKICWLHTDYTKIGVNPEAEMKVWSQYDHISSISSDVTKSFLKVFPSLANKIIEIENIMPKALIEQKVSDVSGVSKKFQRRDGEIILVSVGRICEAKNYDNIPYMAKALKELFDEGRRTKDENFINHFHWYIVGPGNHDEIDALSKELGVDDVVTFLGSSSNPYPYIKACDIYVHPSRYEGKSIVVREAQILCKPVIITNYPTAKSQINDGVDGIICELDNKKIAEAIYQLANDNKMQNEIIAYLQTHDFAGLSEVNKIYQLLEFKDQEFLN